MTIDLKNLTIKSAHASLVKGEFTARELAQAYLDQIEAKNYGHDGINAYLEVYDDVLSQADEAQKLVSESMPLAGIPIAIKDNILIEGRKVSGASKILEGYSAPYDATAIKKLKEAGMVFIGRVNMDEFAMGGSTENSAFGMTRNPHDLSRVSGGSSGGSTAAVAGDMALVSLGSDTGGSVRQPASYCGVVGLKPTYGSISRYGLMAMGSSLDVIGPIGKTVTDVEILFNAMKGVDAFDGTSLDVEGYRKNDNENNSPEKKSEKRYTIGVPRTFLSGDGVDKDVMVSFEKTISDLKDKGYEIKDIELPHIDYSLAVYYVIMPAEVSSNLSRFDGVKYGLYKEGATGIEDYFETRGEGFGKEVRRRIMLGAYVLSSGYYDAYYNKANAVRELLKDDFKKAFESVDAIITPTAPTVAFKIGEKVSNPLSMYLEDIFTVPANIVGIPAISIPAGVKEIKDGETKKELPIGIQIMASHGREDILFSLGKEMRSETE